MFIEIEKMFLREKPGMVFVCGDTNSTLAGALAASKLHIKVAHVEAGLRSFDKAMPEEINSILTDHVSDLLLSPTQTAVSNLAKDGINESLHLVGDVMVDALEYNIKVSEEKSKIIEAPGKSGKIVVFPLHPRTEKHLQENSLCDKRDGESA